jgi:hypothetical protein
MDEMINLVVGLDEYLLNQKNFYSQSSIVLNPH